jgi:hypothetical protein
MTRQRTRPAHSATRLGQLYAQPYHAQERGPDHIERVGWTAGLVAGVMRRHGLGSLADLSCGDGEIARTVAQLVPHTRLWLGDLVPAPGLDATGPIEDTMASVREVDLWLCAETLEHLDDPDAVLWAGRERARWLVCSTPLAAWGDPNPEHYWAWDEGDLHDMLTTAGWTPRTYATLQPEPGYYRFQLWACS